MKKLLIAFLMCLALVSVAQAQESSDILAITSDGYVPTTGYKSAWVTGVWVQTDGTNLCTIDLKDGGTSGTSRFQMTVLGATRHGGYNFFYKLPFAQNIYGDITCSGTCTVYVQYQLRN